MQGDEGMGSRHLRKSSTRNKSEALRIKCTRKTKRRGIFMELDITKCSIVCCGTPEEKKAVRLVEC